MTERAQPTKPLRAPVEADSRRAKLKRGAQVAYHWRAKGSTVLPYLPTEVSLELTNRCNFKCSFCPQSNPDHFDVVKPSALEPDRAAILLGKLRRGGLQTAIIHWTLDGEPFMNKRFHEVLQIAVDYGFKTHHFATNGYFATPERVRQFPRFGSKYFLTPDFCSDEAYFETYRGTTSSWKTVRDNLRGLLEDPELAHVHLKITDISSYKILDPAELDRRFEALRAMFPPSPRVTFLRREFHNATGQVDVAESKLVRSKRNTEYRRCPYPWFSFVVASNGDVVACCRDLEHKTVLGNLFEQEFEEIWNGAAYQALRKDIVERTVENQQACRDCDMPYDTQKGTLRHIAKSALHRMLVFDKG